MVPLSIEFLISPVFSTIISFAPFPFSITASLASLRLRDKGWNAVACSGAQWYVWPLNGSTIKSLVTVDYTGKTPNRTIVKGRVYSQDEIKHDQSSETVWAIIGFIAIVLFIIFLMTR